MYVNANLRFCSNYYCRRNSRVVKFVCIDLGYYVIYLSIYTDKCIVNHALTKFILVAFDNNVVMSAESFIRE